MEYYGVRTNDGLYHHGIKGMHWGIRRFQNTDGSLKVGAAGRYLVGKRDYNSSVTRKFQQQGNRQAAKASADFDKKISNYRKSQSAGKRFIKEHIMGGSGTLTYDMARVNNKGRVGSFLRSCFDINLNTWAGAAAGGAVQKTMANRGYEPNQTAMPGLAVARSVDKALTEKGTELSLQQRHQRNKYIINYGRKRR